MSKGLHIISCSLPNDVFTDSFLEGVRASLGEVGQELLLLLTYTPSRYGGQYISAPYNAAEYMPLVPLKFKSILPPIPRGLVSAESICSQTPLGLSEAGLSSAVVFYTALLDTLEPDTVSVWCPTAPVGRILQTSALLRGIPTFAIERGMVPGTIQVDSQDVGALSQLSINPVVRSVVDSFDVDGSDDFDTFRAQFLATSSSKYRGREVLPGELRKELGIPESDRLAVMLLSAEAFNWSPRDLPGPRHCSPWFSSADEAVQAFAKSLPPDVSLVVQGHPIDAARLRLAKSDRLHLVSGMTPRSLVAAASAVAVLGASTTQYDAIMMGVPLVLLSRSELSGKGIAYEFRGTGLDKIVQDALARRDEVQHFAAARRFILFLLRHVLYGIEGGTVPRTSRHLAEHLASLEGSHVMSVRDRMAQWTTFEQRLRQART